MISSKGFPSSLFPDGAIFPCEGGVGFPEPCNGFISCSTPDMPLCCGGFVTGSVSGGGNWDCSVDLSSCTGDISITGGVKVGIPNCKFCWSLMDFSVKYSRYNGKQACCSGPFAYTKDTISLRGEFFAGIVRPELTGTFYEMATKDDNACKTARPNWIQGGLRKMVIAGKVEICIILCFTIVSGNLYMVPEVALPKPKHKKQGGQCCLLVHTWASKHSCGWCPGEHEFAIFWDCSGSRRCS